VKENNSHTLTSTNVSKMLHII